MKTKGLYFLILTLFLLACNKLDLKPNQNQVVPQTLTDFQSMADNVDVLNVNYCSLGEVAGDTYYLSLANYNSETVLQFRKAYIWAKNTFEAATFDADWIQSYTKVFYANIILDGLRELSASTQADTYNNIKGQALFIRANAFFMLLNEFAKPYNKATANDDLGVVLRLSSDLNIPSSRATVQRCYDRVIADLEEAKELLPVTPLYKTRVSKPAAMALLARVYLNTGDYDKAFQNADGYLKLNSTLLNYNTIVGTAAYPFVQLNNEVVFHATMLNNPMIYQAKAIIDPMLYSSYETNDLRKTLFFKDNGNGTYAFRGNYNGANDIMFNGIANDELYLIRAECNIRLGRRQDGLNDLNSLLSTRYKTGTFVPRAAASDDAALALVVTERRKELVFRGLRWMDLRRLNPDPRFAVTLTRVLDGQTYQLPPNDPKYTFPIPDFIIALNGIQQNP